MDFRPEARQAPGEQAGGLLAGVPADQRDLPQGHGNLRGVHGRNAIEQGLGALQADPAERCLQAFGVVVAERQAAVRFADHVERQHGAVVDQFGDLPHGQAAVAQGGAHLGVRTRKCRQNDGI